MVSGMKRESWIRVPSARTQDRPCRKHSVMPPARATEQNASNTMRVTWRFHQSGADPHLSVMACMKAMGSGGLFRTVETTALAAARDRSRTRTLSSSGSTFARDRRRFIALFAAFTPYRVQSRFAIDIRGDPCSVSCPKPSLVYHYTHIHS